MRNITDIIEEYIKVRLNSSNGGILLLRRNELAEKFQCVPSQINYVLSTRFSVNRGYIIETRRGGGGFVRIIRIPLEQSEDLVDIIYDKIGKQISFNEAINFIRYLKDEEIITKREERLMEGVIEVAVPDDESREMAEKRSLILKTMLIVLLRYEK